MFAIAAARGSLSIMAECVKMLQRTHEFSDRLVFAGGREGIIEIYLAVPSHKG